MVIGWVVAFLGTVALSAVLTMAVEKLAWRFKLLDWPKGRHQHAAATPLAGGLAIFLATASVLCLTADRLLVGNLQPSHWWGVLIGGGLILIGGLLDDKYNLSPVQQLVFPCLAVIAVLLGGVEVDKISHPFGGLLYLNIWSGGALVLLWLLGMMYTTKLLDGVDGLVAGLGTWGSIIIFLFTVTTRWHQPDIAWAALIFAAACLGFLIRNWQPAKIFLGESGSLLIGFFLGVLSIISGGKIAIALLIMGLPILDTAWTIARRWLSGVNPFRTPDRRHLHYRLMDAGLSAGQTALLFFSLTLLFGLAGLFLQAKGKLLALIGLALSGALLIGLLNWWLDKKRQKS